MRQHVDAPPGGRGVRRWPQALRGEARRALRGSAGIGFASLGLGSFSPGCAVGVSRHRPQVLALPAANRARPVRNRSATPCFSEAFRPDCPQSRRH